MGVAHHHLLRLPAAELHQAADVAGGAIEPRGPGMAAVVRGVLGLPPHPPPSLLRLRDALGREAGAFAGPPPSRLDLAAAFALELVGVTVRPTEAGAAAVLQVRQLDPNALI